MIDFKYSKSEDLQKIEDLLKTGRSAEASLLLDEKIRSKKTHVKNERVYLANLCRRLGHSEKSLKLLHSLVRPFQKNPKHQSILPIEIAEYAGALIQLGSSHEALKLLGTFMTKNFQGKKSAEHYRIYSDVYFQLALGKMRCWDYEGALLELNPLCDIENPYWSLVVSVNKAACLVHLKKSKEARDLLELLITQSDKQSAFRLRDNCLELMAQLEIQESRPKVALKILQGMANNSAASLWENLLCAKWSVFAKAESQDWNSALKNDFQHLKRLAEKVDDSETLREIDRMRALKSKDEKLFQKVFYGTTFPIYKEGLLRDYKRHFAKDFDEKQFVDITLKSQAAYSRSGQFLVAAHPSQKKNEREVFDINLETGLIGEKYQQSKKLSSPNKRTQMGNFASRKTLVLILKSLLKDFYKKPSAIEIFESVYPEQYYNPFSSPNRLNQNIFRLRKALLNAGLDLEICYEEGHYLIKAISKAPLSIRVSQLRSHAQTQSLQELLDKMGFEDFTIQQACLLCKIPRRSLTRKLALATDEGLLLAFGSGRRRRYRVPTEKQL